jgi:hypothetical protein
MRRSFAINRLLLVILTVFLSGGCGHSEGTPKEAIPSGTIDARTVSSWSAPYRNWHHYPEHVMPANPEIRDFDGQGYQSFIAESEDLVPWGNMRLAMGYGPEGEFDYGGVVLGAFLYEDNGIQSPRLLKMTTIICSIVQLTIRITGALA